MALLSAVRVGAAVAVCRLALCCLSAAVAAAMRVLLQMRIILICIRIRGCYVFPSEALSFQGF